MANYRLILAFSGIDFDDDDIFESLAGVPNVFWRTQGDLAFASAIVEAPSAPEAVRLVRQMVSGSVPSARAIRLDEDLVAIADIASRVGVTREAVRNWANGTRQSNFPPPRGVVGTAIKVWAWADVNRWLRENLNLGDPEEFPSALEIAQINAHLLDRLRRPVEHPFTPAKWFGLQDVLLTEHAGETLRKSQNVAA